MVVSSVGTSVALAASSEVAAGVADSGGADSGESEESGGLGDSGGAESEESEDSEDSGESGGCELTTTFKSSELHPTKTNTARTAHRNTLHFILSPSPLIQHNLVIPD
jgi:hypothetical protein